MAIYYIECDGQMVPADLMEWGIWFDNSEARRVAITHIDDVNVTTVGVGLNYQFGDGPPLLYETTVFGGTLDEEQARYTTREEAVKGHEEMVARVRKVE